MKSFPSWLSSLKTTAVLSAWDRMRVFFFFFFQRSHQRGLKQIATCSSQSTAIGQWLTALRCFRWALGAVLRQEEGKRKRSKDRQGATDLQGEDRSELIQGTKLWQHGNQSWQLFIVSEQSVIGYCTSPITKGSQRGLLWLVPPPPKSYSI